MVPETTLFSIGWNSIRLSGSAHAIVTTTQPGGEGVGFQACSHVTFFPVPVFTLLIVQHCANGDGVKNS